MAHRNARKISHPKPQTTPGARRRRGPGRTIWLIATGLVAGIAGGAFALRMLVPPGEPDPARKLNRQGSTRLDATRPEATQPVASQPDEILVPEEPVEISTRMRPGEWTEESLREHVENYRQQIRDMGAAESQIVSNVERTEEGAAVVVVSWDRQR